MFCLSPIGAKKQIVEAGTCRPHGDKKITGRIKVLHSDNYSSMQHFYIILAHNENFCSGTDS